MLKSLKLGQTVVAFSDPKAEAIKALLKSWHPKKVDCTVQSKGSNLVYTTKLVTEMEFAEDGLTENDADKIATGIENIIEEDGSTTESYFEISYEDECILTIETFVKKLKVAANRETA